MKYLLRAGSRNYRMGALEALGYSLADLPIDKVFEVTIEEHHPRLPGNLQARISILIRELAQFCGYAESQMKAILKAQYWPHEAVILKGKDSDTPMNVPVSTMRLTPAQAREIEAHLYQLGGDIGASLSIPQAQGDL